MRALHAIAPTGTLRLLAGCSGGLEPWIDPVVSIEIAGSASRRWIDCTVLAWLERHARAPDALLDALAAGRPSTSLPGLGEMERALLRRVDEVPAEQQLALQARVQAHVDGGVSKTVHLPADATVDRVAALIPVARALGCKGVAFWRRADGAPPACIRCAS